jgi:hypothetical protein
MKFQRFILPGLLLVAVLLMLPSSAAAFKLQNDGRFPSLPRLQSEVLKNLSLLVLEPKMLKEQAKIRKMKMAFEYDDIFENYKTRLRRLSDEITLLSEVEDNLKNIQFLTRQREMYEKNVAKKIDDFRNSHASVYIPIVMAAYIEVPSSKDDQKVEFLETALTREILGKYGVDKLFSQKITEGGALVEDVLHHQTMGTLEEDGTKSLDIDFIDRNTQTTKFLTIYFYRFKPFETVGGAAGARRLEQSSTDLNLRVWDISTLDNLEELYGFINSRFPRQYGASQGELVSYIQSLKGLSEKIESGEKRVEYVISSLNRLLIKSKGELRNIDGKIRQLEQQNETIYRDMGLKQALPVEQISRLIGDKQSEKEKLEGVFDYKFILIEEASSRNYSRGLEQSVEEIFTKLTTMIRKKNVDLETAISGGQLQSQEGRVYTFKEEFTDLELFPYVDADKVGVLLSVSVRYNRAGSVPVKAQAHNGGGKDFTESFGDLTLKMRWIDSSTSAQGGVNFSRNPISKRQFQLFADDLRPHIDKSCATRLGDSGYPENYPANFPMLCVSTSGAEAFVSWLKEKTGRNFRLPTDQEFGTASSYGIFSSADDIFYLVLD